MTEKTLYLVIFYMSAVSSCMVMCLLSLEETESRVQAQG